MKVIIGLGNPGSRYENTRHNAGFMFIDKFREYLGWDKYDVGDWREEKKLNATVCIARTENGLKIIMAKPLTFMNLSGEAAQKVLSMYKVDVEKDFVLVHDDLDLKLGSYKIQEGVSPKVHNGVNSVESNLGKKNFLRVRIGIDSRKNIKDVPGDKYVLNKMDNQEIEILSQAISSAVKDLRSILCL